MCRGVKTQTLIELAMRAAHADGVQVEIWGIELQLLQPCEVVLMIGLVPVDLAKSS